MTCVTTIQELRELLKDRSGVRFVPTMGAFHEGHLTLMREAVRRGGTTVVSLFVNPTQFGKDEDFDRYPRSLDRDNDLVAQTGVDVLFVPANSEMYSCDQSSVHVSGVSERWEGIYRPGHFDGVATVVLKLFNIVRPDTAYFGLKDLQQCAVVSTMVKDLKLPIELIFLETVREPSGLAMSSRNQFLTPENASKAANLYKSLSMAARQIGSFEAPPSNYLDEARAGLESQRLEVDYLALVDPETMEPLDKAVPGSRVIGAVRLGGIRLIDNVPVPIH